jgi:phage tail sheath protein FI
MRLAWEPADHPGQLPEKADEFELERSGDAEFGSAQRIYRGIDHQLEIEEAPGAIYYFRVRAWYDQVAGPWSNIRRITPKTLSQMTLQPLEEYAPYDLLAVQRALLRLCAARGDLFAVLSVPQHFRHPDVVEYLSAIIPAGRGRTVGAAAVQAGNGLNVPALTLGELPVLSYAALYHPWLAVQNQLSAIGMAAVRLLPPDGPVIGRMARRTLEQGAWFAPANDPLVDVVALEPGIDRGQWAQLMQTQVNVVRRTSSGFLLLSADTLSLSKELRSINVRRLLILLRRLALREGNRYIFDSNDERFRDRVRARFERFLSDLYSRGAFAGDNADSAYRVVADSSVNLPQSIDRGRFIVELHVAPSEPLKFLKARLVQTGPNQLQIQEV